MRVFLKPGTSPIWVRCLALLVAMVSFQLTVSSAPGSVFANSAAPRILPDRSQVVFQENPGVELIRETITMEWNPVTLSAAITVLYTFENPAEENKTLNLWFMSGNYEAQSFKVSQAGETLPFVDIPAEKYQLTNWHFDPSPTFETPYNKPLEDQITYYGDTGSPARITEWVLTLGPRETTEVEVAYEAVSGYLNDSDYFTPYRTLFYALSPASFFDGDAVLDLELKVPENWEADANLPLESAGGGRYLLKDYVISSEDFYLSLIDKDQLLLGLNSRAILFQWTWPLAAVGFAVALMMRRRKKAAVALVVASLAVLGLNIIKPSYGMAFMMIFFLPIVVVLLIILAAALYLYRRRKTRSDGHPSEPS
ncbi:hypothetical protein [Acidaminobacter hydrogenoformans]|uniref:Uncharacterized protein n=1 Tax=Acidaminobacter hydrogenoformans DSM 2784 TaxID=1120920 RepID=A0A1G5S4F0_9FIRM|nr:hypothetical protein [Acidaminobacter hydrogenoformans]SCZ81196.1 hypothetical protein SAMN03080599_02653 [Acidaminobacter hydrogenoformans DSM 2784]